MAIVSLEEIQKERKTIKQTKQTILISRHFEGSESMNFLKGKQMFGHFVKAVKCVVRDE